jgi:hypothetical protein
VMPTASKTRQTQMPTTASSLSSTSWGTWANKRLPRNLLAAGRANFTLTATVETDLSADKGRGASQDVQAQYVPGTPVRSERRGGL